MIEVLNVVWIVHHTTNTSFPSEETSQSTHPDSSSGAGILPGPPGEIGVVIPPDEHISPPTSEYTSPSTSHNHGPNPEILRSETGIAILPEERRQQNLPSHDDDPPFATEKGKSVSTGGVGVLPGDKEEVGVALLPEERKSLVGTVDGASTDASTRLLRGTPSTSVQDRDISQYTLPATPATIQSNKNTTDGSPHSSHPITPNTTARTYPLASEGVKFKGVPLSEGSQKESGEEYLSATENSIGGRRHLEQGQSDVATSGHGAVAAAAMDPGSHSGHESVRKKAGFMDKLKGEMKVISGKLSHKESMVEEGRRLMGKT